MKKTELTPRQMEKQRKVAGCLFKFLFLPLLAFFLIGLAFAFFHEGTPDSESDIGKRLENELYSAKNEDEFNEAILKIEAFSDSISNDSVKAAMNNLLESKQQKLSNARSSWRQSKINEQFSDYDGRQYTLVNLVKDNMNDPGSFEHIETEWGYHKEDSNKIVIYMEFRGNNAFGALVKNNVTAIADLDGNILEIIN